MGKKLAPFTLKEVKNLNERQADGIKHPYTCGKCNPARVLHATKTGMKCSFCGWDQNWVFEQDA